MAGTSGELQQCTHGCTLWLRPPGERSQKTWAPTSQTVLGGLAQRADVPRLLVWKVEEPEVGPGGKARVTFTSLLAPGGQPQGRVCTRMQAHVHTAHT